MRIPTRKPGKYANSFRDPLMTQGKFDELAAHLARLKQLRPEAIAEVKRLAEMGDFSENAAYQLAKGKLRGMNERMLEIEDHLKFAQIIKPINSKTVRIGSTVTILLSGKEQTFQVLGPTEANPSKGIISHKSPLGSALIGKRKGDTCTIALSGKETNVSIIQIK